jgi:hypothetical protein
MRELLHGRQDVFPKDLPDGLPPMRVQGHSVIPLIPGAKPTVRPMFRYSPLERKEMETQVTELLRKGFIQPSISPFGSPILFVKKKTGELRMCIDFRALNQITIKNRYPLPRIDDLLDKLQGAKVFSSLDLMSGYYQIRLPDDDVEKTAFRTTGGLYEYKIMPFGLTNAPAVFMSHMNAILADLPFVVVYLDDILIFSKDPEQHVDHVRSVLDRLRQHQYYAKLSKCDFFKKELKFLGHIVSPEGIKPDPAKVRIVQEWPELKTVTDIRSFLGLTNYFRKFIEGYSGMAAPLHDLTKGGVSRRKGKFTEPPIGDAHRQAFESLKIALTTAPVLALPDFTKPFRIITDASDFAIGAILLQEERPIAYESQKLSPAERNYHTTDRELLAVKHALEIWRCYLEGVPFTVVTDHNSLIHLQTQPSLSRRQARWLEFFQGFDFDWQYRPGKRTPPIPYHG